MCIYFPHLTVLGEEKRERVQGLDTRSTKLGSRSRGEASFFFFLSFFLSLSPSFRMRDSVCHRVFSSFSVPERGVFGPRYALTLTSTLFLWRYCGSCQGGIYQADCPFRALIST